MTTEAKIKAASTLTYDATIDALYADGEMVGGASDLTRDLMIAHLDDGENHDEDSDETLFDLVVETENSAPDAE